MTSYKQAWLDGELEAHRHLFYAGDGTLRTDRALSGAELSHTHLALARAAERTSRAGGGGGTTLPGRLLLRHAPEAIRTLASRLSDGVVLVSATNGKTSCARMLAAILQADGHAVVHNRAGANLNLGVAAALATQSGTIGLFEVDEAWLPLIMDQVRPRLVVLGNLFRDRLDGYGELNWLLSLWRSAMSGPAAPDTLVACADDPLLSGAGGVVDSTGPEVRTVLFGLYDRGVGRLRPAHPNEGHSCARCDGALSYDHASVGHLGHYRCEHCSDTRPEPEFRATAVREGLDATQATFATPAGELTARLSFTGLYHVFNALAAAAAASVLGASPETIERGLSAARPPFGRGEVISVDGKTARLTLVKNPVGLSEALRVLISRPTTRPYHLWLALNDERADGHDVSWIWDADLEQLQGVEASFTCSGRRAAELGLRLKYAGLTGPIDVEPDLEASFQSALAAAPALLFMMPTYSALLSLRGILTRRGVLVTDWSTGSAPPRLPPGQQTGSDLHGDRYP